MPLSCEAARTDLTDRECAKLIGSLLGGLVLMADRETVRAAVRWWAENDLAWSAFPETPESGNQLSREQALEFFTKGRH